MKKVNFKNYWYLPSVAAWKQYCKSGKKPKDIPTHPDRVYRNKGWISMHDWLGTQKMDYLPFAEAREFGRKLGLSNRKEYRRFKKPATMSSHPEEVYKEHGWKGWKDFLGTQQRIFLPFAEAREYIRKQKIPTQEAWQQYCKSGKKPDNIPPHHIKYTEIMVGQACLIGLGQNSFLLQKQEK